MNYKLILSLLHDQYPMDKVIEIYYNNFEPTFTYIHGKEWIRPIKPLCEESINLYNQSMKNPELRKEADKLKAEFQLSKEMINFRVNIAVYKTVEKIHRLSYHKFHYSLRRFIHEVTGLQAFLDSRTTVFKIPSCAREMKDAGLQTGIENTIKYYNLSLKYMEEINEQLKHSKTN